MRNNGDSNQTFLVSNKKFNVTNRFKDSSKTTSKLSIRFTLTDLYSSHVFRKKKERGTPERDLSL